MFPGNILVWCLALLLGGPTLALGLFVLANAGIDLVSVMTVALGSGLVMNGTAEALPTELHSLAVPLRIVRLCLGSIGILLTAIIVLYY